MSAKRNKNNPKKKKILKEKEQDLTQVRQRRTLNQVEEIYETKQFKKSVEKFLSPDKHDELLDTLRASPDCGTVVQGTSGCRKLRWTADNKGKRGGSRIIYFWSQGDGVIYLLLAYKKSDQTDLTMEQKKALKRLVKES